MITKSLTKALEELGFIYAEYSNSDKNHVYALYGGYLVTVYESAGKKVAYFNFKFSDSEENALKRYDMSETFSAELEEYAVCDYSLSEDGMRVFSTGTIPVFLKLIDRCITLLIENEIKGAGYCSCCGNKFGTRNPKKVTDGKENYLMCDHCALEKVEEVKNRAVVSDSEAKSRLPMGVLGSSLFSLIGVALYFVLYYWLSPAVNTTGNSEIRYIFCATGFIVSLLAYVGYRVFSKKAEIGAYIVISLNTVLFTVIGQYLGVVFEFIAKNGFSVSALSNKHFWLVHLRNTIPTDVAEQFIDYSGVFYKLLAISLMFAVVGAAIFLLSLHEKSAGTKETAEVETIVIKK